MKTKTFWTWKTVAFSILVLGLTLVSSRFTTAGPPGIGPDVTVYSLATQGQGITNYGAFNGIRAYSISTTSCNIGDEPLWWCDNDRSYCDSDQHPVIAQNLYRLKDGRFEQIGMSWLKHGFLALANSSPGCGDGSCESPPHGGDQLGIGCTDPYGASLNGSRPMGMRAEVNATTGVYPFPKTDVAASTLIDQRLQVKEGDLDPALNSGARYWIEGHYVTPDDAQSGNGLNNASYREVLVSGGSFNLVPTGTTIRENPAISVWQLEDSTVETATIEFRDAPGDPIQRYNLARKTTDLGGGMWHYEYALHNMNADQAANSFTIEFSKGASFDNIGYSGIAHHSGEPYSSAAWSSSTTATSIAWASGTACALDNAIRWGTMFSFWFDSDADPSAVGVGRNESLTTVANTDQFSDGFETGDTSCWETPDPS